VCALTLLHVLWCSRWPRSYILFYIGMNLGTGVLFMVLFPGFLEIYFL
jgi:hypothetical protein